MSKKAATEVQNLWAEYKKHSTIESRNQLILKYSYLVKRVVLRLTYTYNSSNPSLDMEDLMSYGILGLMDAIEKYDPSRNVKFETYATFRIKGAIIDQLRKQDWIPRSLRTKTKQLSKAIAAVEKETGKPASDQEIAKTLGVSVEEIRKTMVEMHSFAVVSLEEQLHEIATSLLASGRFDDPEHVVQVNELKSYLAKAIDELPDREKMVISLYYFEELTLKEIGMVLGISESRVSQLHTRALLKLKNKLMRFKGDLI